MNEPYRYSPPVVMPPSDDERNLKMLSIFHYVTAGLAGLCSFFPAIYIALGIMATQIPAGHPVNATTHGDPGAEVMGGIFIAFGALGVLVCVAVATLLVFAGRALASRTRSTLIVVSACIICLWVPFGTMLGVFTLVLMQRPGVKALFDPALRQPG